jgi:hypothetical protein
MRKKERELHAEFIAGLHRVGLPLSEEHLAVAEKLIPKESGGEALVIDPSDRHHLYFKEYLDRVPYRWKNEWRDREITKADWAPESTTEHTEDFCSFINSHIPRFDRLIPYKPFFLYIQQAHDLMNDESAFADCVTKREKLEYGAREYDRCKQNKLYALWKYVYIKDAEAGASGERKWLPSVPQALLCFLFDCGYSFYLGKGRQAAVTSTLNPCFIMRIITQPNSYIKVITEDDKTNKEIFEDKVRYTFNRLPYWLKPVELYHRHGTYIQLTYSKERDKDGKGAKLEMVVPSETAINGGSPSVWFVDEAASVPEFEVMTREGDPTSLGYIDGELKQGVRQGIAASTGVPGGKGKGAFERELRTIIDKWKAGDTSDGVVPLFFDWTCRIGMTREIYEQKKKKAMVGGSMAQNEQTKEERMSQFRMHYPSDLDDMFAVSHRTLISMNDIRGFIDELERKFQQNPRLRPKRGWFEPILDRNKPMPEGSYYPYKCVGASFVPSSDDDLEAPVIMIWHPEADWVNRYYQGTDPLITNSGTSKMASVIWDAKEDKDGVYPGIACIVDHRDTNIEHSYEQVVLMGLHYGRDGQCCPELVEWILGKGYSMFKESPCFYQGHSLVMNSQLPDDLQVGGNPMGIDIREKRRERVIAYLKRLLLSYGKNVFSFEFWAQVKTFAMSYTNDGNERWKTIDYKNFRDDILLASACAFICRLCYPERKAYQIKGEEKEYVIQSVWLRGPDGVKYRGEERVLLHHG